MTHLADTHALIWFFQGAPELSATARALLSDPNITVFASPISTYETEYKIFRGLIGGFGPSFRLLADGAGYPELPITSDHAEIAARMDMTHCDPFDRLLAAQAIGEGLTVITRDPVIAALGAKVIW